LDVDVLLRLGDIRWLFQELSDADERAAVSRLLEAADDLVYEAGKVRGDAPDATSPAGYRSTASITSDSGRDPTSPY
jgi:hypothetical protein